jgi:hypothetical protein
MTLFICMELGMAFSDFYCSFCRSGNWIGIFILDIYTIQCSGISAWVGQPQDTTILPNVLCISCTVPYSSRKNFSLHIAFLTPGSAIFPYNAVPKY